ncbi:hypothetical protein ACDT12_13785, partial [Staphylococcus aureus]
FLELLNDSCEFDNFCLEKKQNFLYVAKYFMADDMLKRFAGYMEGYINKVNVFEIFNTALDRSQYKN